MSALLEDEEGVRWASRDSEPVDRMYPSWMWSAHEAVRDQLRMPIPSKAPAGRYQLRLRLLENGRPLAVFDADGSPLGGTATLIDLEVTRS